MDIAVSKNKVPIRMTDERWFHISTGHPEVAACYYDILDTIETPRVVYRGNEDALIAISDYIDSNKKFLVVIYKEIQTENNMDGFIITAYISNREENFKRKEVVWER